jgi:hypothetical protein
MTSCALALVFQQHLQLQLSTLALRDELVDLIHRQTGSSSDVVLCHVRQQLNRRSTVQLTHQQQIQPTVIDAAQQVWREK